MAESSATRPRVAGDREREILDATLDVLVEQGYDKLTFDIVATKAKASKATLYRKWASKAALVMAAVEHSSDCQNMHAPLEDHGTLAADIEYLRARGESKGSKTTEVMGAIASAIHRDEQLRSAFTSTFAEPQIDLFRVVLERARTRGEIMPDADVELLARVVPAMAVHHAHLYGTKPDTTYVMRIVDAVLLPAAGAAPRDISNANQKGGADVDSR